MSTITLKAERYAQRRRVGGAIEPASVNVAAVTSSLTDRYDGGGAGGGRTAVPRRLPMTRQTLRQASSASIAEPKRFSRSRAMIFARYFSISFGQVSPVVCASDGGSRSSFSAMSVSAFEPSNGRRPVSARNATAP